MRLRPAWSTRASSRTGSKVTEILGFEKTKTNKTKSMCACAFRGYRGVRSAEQELQAVINCLMWVLRIELVSSTRTIYIVVSNCLAISLVLKAVF